jgi:hypothetical protein
VNERASGRQDVIARQMASTAIQGMADAMAAVTAVTPSVGSATVPALALGASTNVVVPISPSIPGAAYIALPILYSTSASLLGNLTVAGIAAKTDNAVTVLVKAPALAVASGATLQIVAFKTT